MTIENDVWLGRWRRVARTERLTNVQTKESFPVSVHQRPPAMVTVLSGDGKRRAVVSECDDGASIAFFRLVYNGDPRETAAADLTSWRYVRTSVVPQPFHVALDLAHAIVHTEAE